MKEYIDEDSSYVSRIFMLSYVVTSLIICGGSVFGFTPLKEILLDEGVYVDMCAPDAALPCENQLAKLDQMFTLAASLFSAWLLPAGLCLRFIGPRMCFLTGFGLVVLGSLGFARLPPKYFTLCYVLIGTGNPLLYIAAFNFGKLFPKASNLLLSVFIGCFGFSSVVFYVFNVLHFECGWASQSLFLGFSVIPILLGLVGMSILPPDPYHVQRQKKALAQLHGLTSTPANENTPLKSGSSISPDEEHQGDPSNEDKATADLRPLKERTIAQQLRSTQFLAQALFFCWGMLHQNFYLGTIGDQIYMFAGDDKKLQASAALILTKFAVFYPIGCIVAILPVGALVRNCSVSTSLFVYSTANTIFSILALVPAVKVQWATSEIYIIVRVGFFTVMSTYSSTIFGFKNLGTMFGCAGCLAGLVSLLGTFLSERALHVDHSFIPVNTALLAGSVLNFAFPTLIAMKKWQDL